MEHQVESGVCFQNPYRKVITEEGNVSSTTAEEEEDDDYDEEQQFRRMASRNMNGHNARQQANGPRAKSASRHPPPHGTEIIRAGLNPRNQEP